MNKHKILAFVAILLFFLGCAGNKPNVATPESQTVEPQENDQAVAYYEKALKLTPKDSTHRLARIYSNIGETYIHKEDYDRAIISFGKAIELNPKDAFAYCYMGEALIKKGYEDEGLEYKNKAAELLKSD